MHGGQSLALRVRLLGVSKRGVSHCVVGAVKMRLLWGRNMQQVQMFLCLCSRAAHTLLLSMFNKGDHLAAVPHQGQACWLEATMTLLIRAELLRPCSLRLLCKYEVEPRFHEAYDAFLEARRCFRCGDAAGTQAATAVVQQQCCHLTRRVGDEADKPGYVEDALCLLSRFYDFKPATTSWHVRRPLCWRCTLEDGDCEHGLRSRETAEKETEKKPTDETETADAECVCERGVLRKWQLDQQRLLPAVTAPCGFVSLSAARQLITTLGYAEFFLRATKTGLHAASVTNLYEFFCVVETGLPGMRKEEISIEPDQTFRGTTNMCAHDTVLLDINDHGPRRLLWAYLQPDPFHTCENQQPLRCEVDIRIGDSLFTVLGAVLGHHAEFETPEQPSKRAPRSARRTRSAKRAPKPGTRNVMGGHFTCMVVDRDPHTSDEVCLLLDSLRHDHEETCSLAYFNRYLSQQITLLLLAACDT